MSIDFTKICRVCLELKVMDSVYDIFTSYCLKRKTSYSEMLSKCTKLQPCEEDGLPRLICKECCKQLKKTYTFATQCEENDKKLRNYLQTGKLSNDINDKCFANAEVKNEFLLKNVKNEEKLNGFNDESKDTKTIIDDSLEKKECLGDDIKTEPNYADNGDDGWDAEDDNLLLGDIKTKKLIEEPINCEDIVIKTKRGRKKKEPVDFEDAIKKKRGRKRKVTAEGEIRTPGSKSPHQCDVCGKLLSTKSNLKAHKLCHTDLRPYQCALCPANFRGHSALFQHKKVHTGETPYHCEYCPKQFSRRSGLVNHIRMHTGEKQYSCDICFKTFVQSAQLSIHMKRHKGEKSFLCQDCGKGFPIKADLKVHQRTHNGEKPYSCHLCTKTFATSGNLSIHIRIHNKEIRYTCKECHRGFVTCSAYNVHLKRHKGQRDYSCECGKTFYTSSALKQHRVVHTGEKKYQCKICDRKFTQTSHLSRHFKRDHAKPNAPAPPSQHYKVVLNPSMKPFYGPDGVKNDGVKCEVVITRETSIS